MSHGVIRQGVVDVRVRTKRILKQSSPRAHLVVLRTQSPRGGARLEIYAVPHGYNEGSSKVKVCRSALQVIPSQNVVSIQEAKQKSKSAYGVQLFMVAEKITFFCKSEFEQKRWIEDIRRVFFDWRGLVHSAVTASRPAVYCITLANLEGGVWRTETDALLEIGSSNVVIFNTSAANPLYMVPLANIASVQVVGHGRSDEMRELKIMTKGEGVTEFVLWSFLCDDIAQDLQRKISPVEHQKQRHSQAPSPSNTLLVPGASSLSASSLSAPKSCSTSDLRDLSGNEERAPADVAVSMPDQTCIDILSTTGSSSQSRRNKVRTSSMKSKNLRQFGSDSDLFAPESPPGHESDEDSDDSFEVPPTAVPQVRTVARSHSDDIHSVTRSYTPDISYHLHRLDELNDDEDYSKINDFTDFRQQNDDDDNGEDDYSEIADGEGWVHKDEENADDDYSKITDWEKESSCPELPELSCHRVARKNVSCPVVHVTRAEKDRQEAALKPFNITQLRQKFGKHPESKPTKLATNGETDGHYRSSDASSSPRELTQFHGQQTGAIATRAVRPKPPPRLRRHSHDNKSAVPLPIPPPKPQTLHKSDHRHSLDSCPRSPCDCGATEQRTELPVRDVTSAVGGCGEETTQKGSYSYIVVRGTETQTAKKPENPRYPQNLKRKKRLASDARRRLKDRAPAAVPRPSHTMRSDKSDQCLDLGDGGDDVDYLSVHSVSSELSDDSNCTYGNLDSDALYVNVNNSMYENIEWTPGLYQNLEEALNPQDSAAGARPEAEGRPTEDDGLVSQGIGGERRSIYDQGDVGDTTENNVYYNVFEGPYENVSSSGW